jgi:hypothetical protein
MELGARDPELPAAREQLLERLEAGEELPPEPAAGHVSPAARARKREVPEVEFLDPGGDFDTSFPQARKGYRR